VDVAKMTSKGQLTIPRDIREKLRLKTGDKVLFIEDSGRVYLTNSSLASLNELVEVMRGEAEKQEIVSETDVNALVSDVRRLRRQT